VAVTKQKLRSVSDQRALRTRQRLDRAFVELLHRRSYDNIRVGEITKKAGVGRATYYAHYLSKDDLLRSHFSRIVGPLLKVDPLDASRLFEHLKAAPRIYKSFMGDRGRAVMQGCFEEHLDALLPRHPGSIPQPMAIRLLASALFSVIESWIETGLSQSPTELQQIFSRLVGWYDATETQADI
jgi:AcrR family transcriptional regulator